MNSLLVCICIGLIMIGAVRSRTTASEVPDNSINQKRSFRSETSGIISDIKFLYRVYEDCSAKDLSSCLKIKLITALDRAARSLKELKVADGVSFVRDSSVKEDSTAISENEIEASLPRSFENREDSLNELIFDKMIRFVQTHVLQFKLNGFGNSDSNLTEGRARRTRLSSLLMVPLLLGGTLIPLSFGALALLAGKALIISKLALALAAIIGLRRLVGGGGGAADYQVVTVPSHGGGGHYRRSLQDVSLTHSMAYKGYLPSSSST